jgi:hypothetical protein
VVPVRGRAKPSARSPGAALVAGTALAVTQEASDVAVSHAGIVTAVAADELKRVGIAALRLAINHAGRLAP